MGFFQDLTLDAFVGEDDAMVWTRRQFPIADVVRERERERENSDKDEDEDNNRDIM